MTSIADRLLAVKKMLPSEVSLVAVSKTRTPEEIALAMEVGQVDFGENYVQELRDKQPLLPATIHWHFIGHLQTNKVKYIAPFVQWIHAVDSEKLLAEIDRQAARYNRIISCLLQIHVAEEETKEGFSPAELLEFVATCDFSRYPHARVCGVMAMATMTNDQEVIRSEFRKVAELFHLLRSGTFNNQPHFREISMGMSSDWQIATGEGSTMVRIGSSIFGKRL